MEKRKIIYAMCGVCLLLAFCITFIPNTVFAENNVTCQFSGGTLNNGSINYTINNQTISIELATKANEIFTKVDITNLQMSIDLDSASYYIRVTDKTNANLINNGTTVNNMPGDGYLMLETSMFNNGVGIFELSAIQQPGPGGPGEPGQEGPAITYPIVAYFEGVNTGVEMDEEGRIIMPDNWTTGKVTFKAKICTVSGVVSPDDGYNIPDVGSQEEITVRIEGITNGNQLNGTVTGSSDRTYVTFNQGFDECGKATIHITSVEENGPINTIINIVSKDMICLIAGAPLSMSMSVGSAEVSEAIVTKDVEKNLSIFFGNTQTTLIAKGINVNKITAVTGGTSTTINEDGSAIVKLPDLSKETTTKVKVTILLNNGQSIIRTVNIKRTAILLSYDDRAKELSIGYVMNKTYLYDNKTHNDNIFNAYIQVILYKGNTVAGFKQIKVDDTEIINALVNGTQYNGLNLPEDGSWSIETFDDNAMKINSSSMEGITKVSVFLTNGPLKADSDTLPSVEYGIGSGLTIELEAE